MPRTSVSLRVEGSVGRTPDGPLLVLTERLDGHDTFLSGSLDVDGMNVPVRIMTLDDVTVLHPTDSGTVPTLRARWSGTLHLPHGLRPQVAPEDLQSAAEAEGRILAALDDAELRYALTFLSEATTPEIRTGRIAAIVSALPPTARSRMTRQRPHLISVDVGGTLGYAEGPGLTMRLAAASPLPPKQAREIMRNRLHTQPSLDDAIVADVCEALQVAHADFPRDLPPAPLMLFPGTMDALRVMSEVATVVTLSNVTCADADTEGLRRHTAPWVSDFFPSCRIGYAKPDQRAFHAVAEHCGVAPAHILHIGDDWACDVVGAVAAGLQAVWISRGRPAPDPDLIVDHGVLVADDLSAAAQHVLALSSTEETP